MTPADPIRAELVRSHLVAAVADMGQVLSRNAVSTEIVEEKDYANGIVLERGEVVMMDNLLHLGAASATSAVMQDNFQFSLRPGDVILSNDPYSGGTHIQDFTVLTPFFHERDKVCCILCRAHLPDIGGQVPGGYFPFADDVWAEGSRIPPLKIVQEGKIVRDKLDAVAINSRCPDKFEVNLRAMLAALATGRARLEPAFHKFGKEALCQGLRGCIDASIDELKAGIAAWSKGEYEGVSMLDHDCRGGLDLEVRATLRVGCRVVVDLSRSAPQSSGFVNSSRSNTIGCVLVPFYALLGASTPINSALLQVIEIITAEGTVVHPRFPAAVGWGPFHIGAEIISAVTQAIGHMVPERAAVLAPKTLMLRASWKGERLPSPLHGFLQGGGPGAFGTDGWGVPGPFSRATTPSVEMVESHAPVRLRRLELLAGSAGQGKWRGGLGTVAEIELREPVRIQAVIEGQEHPSESVAGGSPGGPNSMEIESFGAVTGFLWDQEISPGVLTVRMGGGGGWGKPEERDPAALSEDMQNELLSGGPSTGPQDMRGENELASAARRKQP